jgi:hypothetical protein
MTKVSPPGHAQVSPSTVRATQPSRTMNYLDAVSWPDDIADRSVYTALMIILFR